MVSSSWFRAQASCATPSTSITRDGWPSRSKASSESGPLAVVALERGTSETDRTWERLEPFRPFTLETDEVAWFVMRTRPGTCGGAPNVTLQRRSVSIRYRYLWFLKRTQEVELPYELRLRCS